MTAYQRIKRAYEQSRGVKLTAAEVRSLASDDAIWRQALNDEQKAKRKENP